MNTLTLLFSLLPWFSHAPAGVDAAEAQYINTFHILAVEQMHATGIPASIKLAQALVESDAGRSVLARRANNHFGIKCKSWWSGGEYYYADDDRDASGRLTASCFRIYDSAEASFADHGAFLQLSDRYASLFRIPVENYKAWARGLQQCGYATSSHYAEKLIQVIEEYRLYELDKVTPSDLLTD